jgi:4-hydroxy-3-polyprenylbenzoate decarboxylase
MRVALAISGASGVMLGFKCLKALAELGYEVHLTITKDACHTAVYELGKDFSKPQSLIEALDPLLQKNIFLYSANDFSAPIASGSYGIDATLIVPCSMASLAAIAMGLSDNLLRRSADVAIKEKRRLLIVPREAPFSSIHLENMHKLANLGATIFVPTPSWYIPLATLDEIEDQLVGRMLQLIGIQCHSLQKSWQGEYQERIKLRQTGSVSDT